MSNFHVIVWVSFALLVGLVRATYRPGPAMTCVNGYYDLIFEKTFDGYSEALSECMLWSIGKTSVRTCGFVTSGDTTAQYSKVLGGDESGLGLVPGLDHEDSEGYLISIDATNLPSPIYLQMSSITGPEVYQIYGSQNQYAAGNTLTQNTLLLSSSSTGMFALPSGYKFYFVTVQSSPAKNYNVLIYKISILCAPVPAPSPVAPPRPNPSPVASPPQASPVAPPRPNPSPVASPPQAPPVASPCVVQYYFINAQPSAGCTTFTLATGVSLKVCGYSNNNAVAPLRPINSGNDQGIGIQASTNGPIGITGTQFIQLDTSGLPPGLQIQIGGLSQGEGFTIYSSNTVGTLGTQALVTGTSSSTSFITPVGYTQNRYISIKATAGSILLRAISISCSQAPTLVPTPAPTTMNRPYSYTFTETITTTTTTTSTTVSTSVVSTSSTSSSARSTVSTYSFSADTRGATQLTAYGFTVNGQTAGLITNGNGLGVTTTGSQNAFQIGTNAYIVLDVLTLGASVNTVQIVTLGGCPIRIFGSNLLTSTPSSTTSFLLYSGPAGVFTLSGSATSYRYISIISTNGCYTTINRVSVTFPCTATVFRFPTTSARVLTTTNTFIASGSIGFKLTVSAFSPTRAPIPLSTTTNGLGIAISAGLNIGVRKLQVLGVGLGLGSGQPQPSDIRNTYFVELDVSAYVGTPLVINFIGRGNIVVFGSNRASGTLNDGNHYRLYQGPVTPFAWTQGTIYPYLQISVLAGSSVRIESISIGCPYVVRPIVAPTCPVHFGLYNLGLGIRSLVTPVTLVADTALNLNINAFGYTAAGVPTALFNTGNALGIAATGSIVNNYLNSNYYIMLDVNSFLSTTLGVRLDLLGIAAEVAIYGTNTPGGVLGGNTHTLIYLGPPVQYTYAGGNYRYLIITAPVGYIALGGVATRCTGGLFVGILVAVGSVVVSILTLVRGLTLGVVAIVVDLVSGVLRIVTGVTVLVGGVVGSVLGLVGGLLSGIGLGIGLTTPVGIVTTGVNVGSVPTVVLGTYGGLTTNVIALLRARGLLAGIAGLVGGVVGGVGALVGGVVGGVGALVNGVAAGVSTGSVTGILAGTTAGVGGLLGGTTVGVTGLLGGTTLGVGTLLGSILRRTRRLTTFAASEPVEIPQEIHIDEATMNIIIGSITIAFVTITSIILYIRLRRNSSKQKQAHIELEEEVEDKLLITTSL